LWDRALGEDIMVVRADGSILDLAGFSGIVSGINESFDEYLRRLRVLVHSSVFPDSDSERLLMQKEIESFLLQAV